MEYDPRAKLLGIFEAPTIYQNDYQKYAPNVRYQECSSQNSKEPSKKILPEYKPKDPATMAFWKKDSYIPFDLMIDPRPIIDTSPTDPILQYEEPAIDEESVRKTRPRFYISPGVPMDNVEDTVIRKALCEYLYTTDFKRVAKEATSDRNNLPITEPVELRVEPKPRLPPDQREMGEQCNKKQIGLVKYDVGTDPFKGLVPDEIKKEISQLLQDDMLCLPHDYAKPGYTGYRPSLSYGVQLTKTRLPPTHPLLPVTEVVTQPFDKHSENT
ncbi:hypothetical protein FQA39_LY06688 [Lamprigera yunnana]|nr:hypothetical protein FQA39_LY06688 [Lamprigera yunnana]